jgi:hypothetical protein
MKRFLIVSILLAAVVTGTVIGRPLLVRAENPMTEAQIERIKSNCVEAQSALYQLHASDALLRVNRGQLYESMSTKLMEPFDGWLTLNSYNASDLVSIAADYNDKLNEFRTDYQQYEEAMSKTLDIKCTNQPVAFYDSVADTREKRGKVHESTLALHQLIRDYKKSFEDFTKDFKGANK